MSRSPAPKIAARAPVGTPIRRALSRLLPLVAAAAMFLPQSASALLELDITRGNTAPLPIAIPNLVSAVGDAQLAAQMTAVISADLARSGIFAPANPTTFIQTDINPDALPRFGDWRIIGTQALLTGRVTTLPGGQTRTEIRLWDVFAGEQLVGQSFTAGADNWRRVAHQIADLVYQRLTGEPGYFDSRIVFIDETGPKDDRIKRLAIMDQDGANLRYLTQGGQYQLVLTPRFSPNSQDIAYMVYPRIGNPRIVLYNTVTGQEEVLGNFPGATSAPRFSPDGNRVILSMSEGADTNIFAFDLRTGQTTRLTNIAAINTSASYSPDGQRIVFTSDRSATPQIYVMNADGTNQTLISRGGGYYSTPVWSPRGDLITFTREVPGENGGPQLWSIDLTGYNEIRIATPNFASDPSWSPLLN